MKKFLDNYVNTFIIFIFGSCFGFILENIVSFLKGDFSIKQGLIYGPFIPVYGVGVVLYFIVFTRVRFKFDNRYLHLLKMFLLGFLLGGITEYIFSYLQEQLFGTVSWDYSYLRFNLQGRTSLLHSTYWGILGVIFYYYIIPYTSKIFSYTKKKYIKIILLIFSIFIIYDCIISSVACIRQKERWNNKKPSNTLEEYLDKNYSDEYLKKIFNNAKKVK